MILNALNQSCRARQSKEKYMSEVKPEGSEMTESVHSLDEQDIVQSDPSNIKISRFKSRGRL